MEEQQPQRRVGRPRREDGPKLPYSEVDRLLVEGELVAGPGGTRRVWPSQRELAGRFGVSPSLIGAYSSQHDCARRKAEFQAKQAAPPDAAAPEAAPAPTAEVPAEAEPPAPARAPMPVVARTAPEPAPAPRLPPPAPAPPPLAETPFSPETKRAPGRPRKADAPLIAYEELDRLLVFGEVQQLEDGASTTVYPSHRQLAERYKVAPSVIANYAKSHNCMRRREEAKARIAVRTEEKLIEKRATALAVTKDDAVRMIDGYLLNFEKALQEGRVRFDSPADFNTMLRLKEFVLGGADSRQELHAALSLESLQQRHARMLREVREATPALTGVIDAQVSSSETERTASSTRGAVLLPETCSTTGATGSAPPTSPSEPPSLSTEGAAGEQNTALDPAQGARDGADVGPGRAEAPEDEP